MDAPEVRAAAENTVAAKITSIPITAQDLAAFKFMRSPFETTDCVYRNDAGSCL
jgi:hypothetical protein